MGRVWQARDVAHARRRSARAPTDCDSDGQEVSEEYQCGKAHSAAAHPAARGVCVRESVWCGLCVCGMVWHGVVWHGMVWYGMAWYGMVWYGMVWHGMIWYGTVWNGMVWHGMAWYGMA
jgi:hypothetical protein